MIGGETDGLPDLTAVLEKVETIVPGLAPSPKKTAMVGIYQIWHRHLAPDFHRPGAAKFLEKHEACMDEPTSINFVISLVARQGLPEWTLEEYMSVAGTRRAERTKSTHFDVPPQFDACLHLHVADLLKEAGRHDEALKYASYAVEEMPGNEMLIEWERRLVENDHDSATPIGTLLFGLDTPPVDAEGTEGASGGEAEEGLSQDFPES